MRPKKNAVKWQADTLAGVGRPDASPALARIEVCFIESPKPLKYMVGAQGLRTLDPLIKSQLLSM